VSAGLDSCARTRAANQAGTIIVRDAAIRKARTVGQAILKSHYDYNVTVFPRAKDHIWNHINRHEESTGIGLR